MKNVTTLVPAVAALGLGLAACSGNGGSGNVTLSPQPPPKTVTYTQIERLSRPAVKEVFERFVDHQISNAAEPYNDPTLQSAIQGVTDTLRPPNAAVGSDYGKALASILYPDEYTVDLSQSGKASYLGAETGGATGGKFGGRDIGDNVIDISLGALFGKTLPALGVQPEDNEENNCLTTQHVAQAPSQSNTGSFPYLSPPH
jgi:hypothetical protein